MNQVTVENKQDAHLALRVPFGDHCCALCRGRRRDLTQKEVEFGPERLPSGGDEILS